MDKEFHLKKSKTFCMFPFIGARNLHGYYSPCPIFWKSETLKPDLKIDSNIFELSNTEYFKQLRKDMIENNENSEVINSGCRICKQHSSNNLSGLRDAMNTTLSSYYDKAMENLNIDYSLKSGDYIFSAVNLNTLCNFKCVMCTDDRSSSHMDKKDTEKFAFYNPEKSIREKMIDDMYSIVRDSKFIYFGYSGEPFLTKDHIYTLNKLIADKRTDKTLIYHSNCSIFTDEIADILLHFDKVILLGSIDGMDSYFKFIRPSSISFETVYSNIKKFKSLPNVDFNLYCSVSILNAEHVLDIHRRFYSDGIINVNQIVLNPVYDFLSVEVLPQSVRDRIYDKYQQYAETVRHHTSELNFHHNTIDTELNNFSNYIKNGVTPLASPYTLFFLNKMCKDLGIDVFKEVPYLRLIK